jgi:hypothetical protein
MSIKRSTVGEMEMDPQEMSNGQKRGRRRTHPHDQEIERQARASSVGLWAGPHAEPWPFRTCMNLRVPVIMWRFSCDRGVE